MSIRKKDYDRLSKLSQQQQETYLRRSSVHFLECAIHLCVTHMGIEEVARLLEVEAEHLREYR
jgi:hypothetical protein